MQVARALTNNSVKYEGETNQIWMEMKGLSVYSTSSKQ